MIRKIKKLVLGAVLLALLVLGALFGSAINTPLPGLHVAVPVAHADCDGGPPNPGVDCPATPTPTPPGN